MLYLKNIINNTGPRAIFDATCCAKSSDFEDYAGKMI